MACGVPVISTNAGGLPEINVNGKTGYLSEVGDVTDMSDKSIYILESEERLEQFKDAAINHARTFEKSRIIPLYEQLYDRVLMEYKESKAQLV
jgi:glycosyltransferase involved in cell wall biosynthesis